MHEITKYLMESCRLCSDEHFSLNFLPRFHFVGKISPKSADLIPPLSG